MAQPKTRSVFQWSSLFRTTLVGGTIRIGLVSAALIAVPAFFITRFDEDIKNSVILRATRLVRDLNPSHQQWTLADSFNAALPEPLEYQVKKNKLSRRNVIEELNRTALPQIVGAADARELAAVVYNGPEEPDEAKLSEYNAKRALAQEKKRA